MPVYIKHMKAKKGGAVRPLPGGQRRPQPQPLRSLPPWRSFPLPQPQFVCRIRKTPPRGRKQQGRTISNCGICTLGISPQELQVRKNIVIAPFVGNSFPTTIYASMLPVVTKIPAVAFSPLAGPLAVDLRQGWVLYLLGQRDGFLLFPHFSHLPGEVFRFCRASMRRGRGKTEKDREKRSVFVDKAVNGIITGTGRAMGEIAERQKRWPAISLSAHGIPAASFAAIPADFIRSKSANQSVHNA